MAASKRSRSSADARSGQAQAAGKKFLKGLEMARQAEARSTGKRPSDKEVASRMKRAAGASTEKAEAKRNYKSRMSKTTKSSKNKSKPKSPQVVLLSQTQMNKRNDERR
jgi:hypothetical protein